MTPDGLQKRVLAYARISLSTWQVCGADEAELLHDLPEPLRAEICAKCVGGSIDACAVLSPALAGGSHTRRRLLRALTPALYMDGEVDDLRRLTQTYVDFLRITQTYLDFLRITQTYLDLLGILELVAHASP